MRILRKIYLALLFLMAASAGGVRAQEEAFSDSSKWGFTNGPEYPGAVGSFSLVEEDKRNACAIKYDFSGGGSYVSAGLKTSTAEEFGAVQFSVKDAQAGVVIVRVTDASGECFQFKKRYTTPGEWEDVRVDIGVRPVESWGGDANKTIDFPVKSIWFGVPKGGDKEPAGTLFVSDLKYEAN